MKRDWKTLKVWSDHVKETCLLEDLGITWRVILKSVLKKYVHRRVVNWIYRD
jgi:hypothetical protein